MYDDLVGFVDGKVEFRNDRTRRPRPSDAVVEQLSLFAWQEPDDEQNGGGDDESARQKMATFRGLFLIRFFHFFPSSFQFNCENTKKIR